MWTTRLVLMLISCVGILNAAAITLTPGSLLVQQVALPSLTTANVASYTKSGSSIAMAQVSGTSDIAENLTVLNGNLYVSDGAGNVNLINLATGGVTSSFYTGTFGLNGIGSLNGDLLTLPFNGTAAKVYSSAGTLVQTINLASHPTTLSWNGIASDGTTLYLADSTSGRIYEYSTAGTQLGFFSTAAVNALSGISYDSTNNSLWISDTATNQVFDLSTTGTQLSVFSLGSFRPGSGIAVVPGSSSVLTPEPSYQVLLALSFLFGAAYRLRQAKPR